MRPDDRPRQHDPLAKSLSAADDRVRLNAWLPPQAGVVPKIRFGQRWLNVLWLLPLSFLVLVIGVAVAQALRELPAVQDFLVRYPGIPRSAVAVTSGFPAWLRRDFRALVPGRIVGTMNLAEDCWAALDTQSVRH